MDTATSSANKGMPSMVQPEGWQRPKGYANGMLAEGRILVTGGVIGWDEQGVFAPDFAGQAARVFANIRAILAAGGAGPEHLVRLTRYVVDMDEYTSKLRAIGRSYREIFGSHYPAMAVVQVVRLVEAAARLEFEATAVLPRA